MRFLVLFLLACASGLASTVDASATCNGYESFGNWVGAVYSASCGDSSSSAGAEVSISGVSVEVFAGVSTPGEGAKVTAGPASASLGADYVLTVTGGSGEGLFQPAFSYSGGYDDGSQMSGTASAVCVINLWVPPQDTQCYGIFMPFVFGTPETLDVSLSLWAEESDATFSRHNFGVGLSLGCCSFEFFDDQWQPLTGVSYTFVPAPGETPTPEPGTFLLFAGAGCAGLVRRLLRYPDAKNIDTFRKLPLTSSSRLSPSSRQWMGTCGMR
jgi:hypothetical protein